jgi:hypothetical protein
MILNSHGPYQICVYAETDGLEHEAAGGTKFPWSSELGKTSKGKKGKLGQSSTALKVDGP